MRHKKLNSTHYIGAALILASVLPVSHGAKLLGAQNTFMQHSSKQEAVVVNHAIKSTPLSGKTNPEVYLVVEYRDDDGNPRTTRTNVASYPVSHAIGDRVEVRVHHTQVDDVRLTSFAGQWLESAVYLVPGLLTLGAGLFLMLKKSRARAR